MECKSRRLATCLISCSLLLSLSFSVEEMPLTLNLKNGTRVLLKSDYTWEYVVTPSVKRTSLGFAQLKFGSPTSDFYELYNSKKNLVKEWPEEGVLYLDDTYASEPATLFYYFKKGLLYHGEVVYKINSKDNNAFLDKFSKIKKMLTGLYGKPTKDYKLYAEWDFEDYNIKHLITKQKDSLFLGTIIQDNLISSQIDRMPTANKQLIQNPLEKTKQITVNIQPLTPSTNSLKTEKPKVNPPAKDKIDQIKNLLEEL